MGQIVFQPSSIDKEEIQNATLVIFPERVDHHDIAVVTEWAGSTQTPIFCNSQDIALFEAEGFGGYRFHRLDSYREVDFQKGSIEFFPAKRWKKSGWRASIEQSLEYFGVLRIPAFHVLIRPKNERPILFLASPQIDRAEWSMFSGFQPSEIVGSVDVPEEKWMALSAALKTNIVSAEVVRTIRTQSVRTRIEADAKDTTKETTQWIQNLGA